MVTQFNYLIETKKEQILNPEKINKNDIFVYSEIVKKYQLNESCNIEQRNNDLFKILSIEQKIKNVLNFHKRTKFNNCSKNDINLLNLLFDEKKKDFDISLYKNLDVSKKRNFSNFLHKFDKF